MTTSVAASTAARQHPTADHAVWHKHKRATRRVPDRDASYRGCHGLAFMPDVEAVVPAVGRSGQRLFVPDESVLWALVLDRPDAGRGRGSRDAAVCRTDSRYGVPRLTTPTRPVDFRVYPHRTIDVRWLRALNAVDLAMTRTAAEYRHSWRPHARALDRELPAMPALGVLPTPYLRFDGVTAADIRDDVFRPGGGDYLPAPVMAAFCLDFFAGLEVRCQADGTVAGVTPADDSVQIHLVGADRMMSETVEVTPMARLLFRKGQKVSAGDPLAVETYDAPRRTGDLAKDFAAARQTLGRYYENLFSQWFVRQIVRLGGDKLLRADLAAPASGLSCGISWDMADCLDAFDPSFEGVVVRPVPAERPCDTRGVLSYGVAYDFSLPEA